MKKLILLLLALFTAAGVTANAETVYRKETVKPVSKGVSYINIRTLDENGWNNFNILKADLSEPGVSLKILSNGDITKKSTVEQFVSAAENVVGAVNADFFTTYPSGAACEGLFIKDGKLVSTPSNDKSYASLAITDEGSVFADYFTFEITVTSERTGDMTKCLFYNKIAPEEYLKIYDSGFGRKSPGSFDDGYEVVVEDGVVVDVLSNKEGVEIPENGYVLHNSLRHSLFLMQNFEIGDGVVLRVELTPDIEGIRDAVGGGTILLENGVKTKPTLKDSRQPMTAVGTDKENGLIYFLAVDGRLPKSRGITFSEAAELFASLGCSDAVSFDGGGSTSMVLKSDGAVSRVNMQTTQRAVINAVGIESKGKSGVLSYLEPSLKKDSVRLGESVGIDVAGYDEYMKSVPIGSKLVYSSDKRGRFDENVYTPGETGKHTLTVTAGKISRDVTLEVKEAEVDENYRDIYTEVPEKEGFTVGFFGDNGNYGTLYTRFITSKRNAIAGNCDVAIFRQYPDGELTTDVLSAGSFSAKETKAGAIVCLNNKNGSYTASDAGALSELAGFLNKTTADNIFIVLPKPFSETDGEENKILTDMLKNAFRGKGIFIISFGKTSVYKYDDGIRYITVNDLPNFTCDNPYDAVNNSKYGIFTLSGGELGFRFGSYFE